MSAVRVVAPNSFAAQSGLRAGLCQTSACENRPSEEAWGVAGAAADLGGGTILSHFTDAPGMQGITGLDALAPGESATVDQLNFAMGENSFLASSPGDIFITDLSATSGSGSLSQIGVFAERQAFSIEMSQETLLENGIRPIMQRPSIFTIPGGTSLFGVFRVTARF